MSVEAKRKELWTKTETYRGFIVAIHVVSVIALTMLQSTSAASAPQDDDMLLLLVPSIAAANRVKLSANSLAPLKLLTVTGRRFDPTAAIAVRFFDDQGYDVEVPVFEPSTTAVTVAVPPFIDFSTGAFAAGTVAVQVVQKKGGVTRRSIAVAGFEIKPLLSPNFPPGEVSLALFDLISDFASDIQVRVALLENFPTDALLTDLNALLNSLAVFRNAIETVRIDPFASVNIGTFDGISITLTQDLLPELDRLMANYLVALFEPSSPIPCPEAKREFDKYLLEADSAARARGIAAARRCKTTELVPVAENSAEVGVAVIAFGALVAAFPGGFGPGAAIAAVGAILIVVPSSVVIQQEVQAKASTEGELTEQSRQNVRDSGRRILNFIEKSLLQPIFGKSIGVAQTIDNNTRRVKERVKEFIESDPLPPPPPPPPVTIDSLSCDVGALSPFIVRSIEFSGSASGPVGSRVITSFPDIGCPAWGEQGCFRNEGEPFTTTWTSKLLTNTTVKTHSILVRLVLPDPVQILEFSKTLTCPGF